MTVKQLSPGHHAVGLPVQVRVNLYILGEKMSWLGHGKLTIEHRSQWGCHGDATRNKNGIKQNQVRINAQFKSSWIYYGNTRGGNNWVNINPCDTETAQEGVLRHKLKYYRESVEGLIWGCHRSIRLYVLSVQCCKHCKSLCSRGGFKNRLTGSSIKDMPMHRHGGILDVSHRQINSVNHHFEHCGHTLSSSRNIFGRI